MDNVDCKATTRTITSCAGKIDDLVGSGELLTVAELSERIKFSRQTLYNKISAGVFVKGLHYFKPSPKKILFFWPAIQAWIKRGETEVERAEKVDANRINI